MSTSAPLGIPRSRTCWSITAAIFAGIAKCGSLLPCMRILFCGISIENAMAGMPRSAAERAAATVPEAKMSWMVRFSPRLMPDATASGLLGSIRCTPIIVESAGLPETA